MPQSMPGACATGTPADTVNCFTLVEPRSGIYTLTLRGAFDLLCRDPSQDCSCRPASDGACANPNVTLYGGPTPLPLEFTFADRTSLEGQVLEIAAPPE